MDLRSRFKAYYKRILSQTLPLHRYPATQWLIRDIPPNVRWISSPECQADSNDLVVLSLVRNGGGYINGFIEHHLKLGAKHIVLLDNGSTDGTIEAALAYGTKVTIIQCTLPFSKYQTSFRCWLARRFGQGCWCLNVDIDERFDFPYSDKISLKDFLSYLNSHQYSGVVAQMVDLFAEAPITAWPQSANVERECVWYDHTNRVTISFDKLSQTLAGNRYASQDVKILAGGIRKGFFDVGRPLTKQALFFPSRGSDLLTAHWNIYTNFADISCAIMHYPFSSDFYERCIEIVERNSHWKDSREYRIYLAKLIESGSEFTFKKPTAKRLENVDQLIEDGHLVVSETYLSYVDELQKKRQE